MSSADDVWGEPDVPRDRWSRPLIVPPNGGKPTAYTRCTTYVGCLEDTYNLSKWQQRMVATGLAARPDLVLAAAAHHDEKSKMDEICQSALDAAAAGAAAGVGTALHKLTERLDRGQEIGVVPEAYQADIDAYAKATAALKPVHVEQFCVMDALKIGGTPDLVVEYGGELYIADKKTGSIEWGAGKIAMQLAVYSRSVAYRHGGEPRRAPLGDVNQDRALVIHLPAGQGVCELKWVDIAAGWKAVDLASQVRTWRARKHLIVDIVAHQVPEVAALAALGTATEVPLTDQIDRAASDADLEALWSSNRAAWTDEHTAAAKKRKQHLHQQSLRDAVDAA